MRIVSKKRIALGGGTDDCGCSVTVNGAGQSIACGASACVGGTTYACSASAALTMGSACSSSSGGGGTTGGGSSCGLFTCKTTSDCGGVAPCESTSTGTSYCYEQEADPSACSSGTTATGAVVDGMERTLCVPAGCPQPVSYVP